MSKKELRAIKVWDCHCFPDQEATETRRAVCLEDYDALDAEYESHLRLFVARMKELKMLKEGRG